jgi:ligand-binding sensor domain-containing protein/serine phosphatase RsbU (regulator of sigma subunit)
MSAIKTRLLLFSLLTTRILFSQQYLRPEILSLEKGLLNPSITDLAIDSKGFIWTGTENGLYRYDGYQFKWVGLSPGKAGIIGSKKIFKIEKDKENDNLWLLTDDGLELYNRSNGIMTIYTSQVIHPQNIPVSPLIDFYAGYHQTLWIISASRLFKMIPGATVSSFPLPIEKEIIPKCITSDNHGNLWIGTNNGVLVFELNSEKFTELFSGKKNNAELLTNGNITCMFTDHEDNLWIGTHAGLNRFDPMDIDFDKSYPVQQPKNSPLNEIRSIREDSKGNLILVTGGGILYYKYQSGKFTVLQINLPGPSYTAQFSSVIIDQQGILWIGSRNGLIKFKKAPLLIDNISVGKNAGLKINDNNITAITIDKQNRLWLGYKNSGITVIDHSPGRSVSFYTAGNSNLSGNNIQSFYTGRQDRLYIVSSHAIDRFNAVTSTFEPILDAFSTGEKKIFDDLQINTITEDSLSNFWAGTNNGLVYVDIINKKCNNVTCLKKNDDSIVLSVVYDIKTDRDKNIWIASADGFICSNFQHNQFSRFTPYDKDLLNTGHKNVYTIKEGGRDFFWIGTSEGCYQFDTKKKTFSAVSTSPDLLNAEVLSIASDTFENIWMATNLGIFYYIPALQSIRHFDFIDGLENYGFYSNAAASGREREVYFGGRNGLTVVHYDSLFSTSVTSPTNITTITLLHKGKTVREYLEKPDTVIIPHGNYALKVEFSLTDFNRPEKNHYRYSISPEGKDGEWNELYASNSLVLGGLSQGNYVLKIIGSSGNGDWNSKPDELLITIEVPIWQSKTAYSIYFILVLAFFVLLFRYWARQLIRANKTYKEREKIARQIMLQKEELTVKNKSITDSINYARRIQNAMLPPLKLLKSYFPQSFLLYLPKDIVSGDFYWVNKLYNKIFISAVDCTGHGVPGAFMSIIGFELFRKITNIEGLTRPSDILNKLNEDFHEIFRDVDNIILRDGMDVAFCAIDINDMILEYSGAFNPLYLIRDNKITEIKGDRFAIGLDETNFKDQTFKNHMIPLQEGDLIYIFSDGFADQFGGPEGKKFKYRRFRHLLLNIHQLNMEDQREFLETSLRDWKGDHEQVDDVMVIGIKIDF